MNDDSGMSQRERRRQQHNKNRPSVNLNTSDLKKWAGPLALLVLVGGVVAIMVVTDNADAGAFGCNSHYHFTNDIFIDGEKVLLNAPDDNKFVDNVGHDLHLHESTATGSGLNLVHAHYNGGTNTGLHPENCFSYDDVEDMSSMEITPEGITLRAVHGEDLAGDYPVEGNKTLTVWGQGWEDSVWVELDLATLGDKVPPMSSRIAYIYGEQPDDVQAFLNTNATPYPGTSYPPSDESGANPPHYTSFDDLTDKP